MPTLAYIPKAVLAAVIVTSVIFMFELDEIKRLWNSRSRYKNMPSWPMAYDTDAVTRKVELIVLKYLLRVRVDTPDCHFSLLPTYKC